MPLEFPDEALNQDEFQHILSNMGKRSFKRKTPEPEAGDGGLETGAAGSETPMEKKRRMRAMLFGACRHMPCHLTGLEVNMLQLGCGYCMVA